MNIINSLLNPKHRIKIIIAVIILAVAGFFGYQKLTTKPRTPQYQTTQAQRGTLVVTVSASGQVSSVNNSNITTQTSGVVKKVFVKNGDVVKAGQPIAQLDLDVDGILRQSQAYSTYIAAVSAEKTAENNKLADDASMWTDQQAVLNAQNTENYKNNNSINPSTKTDYTDLEKQSIDSALTQANKQFLSSQTKYIQADQSVSSARAAVTSDWLAYQQTSPTIVAPISGTVDGLALEVGSVISQNTSSANSSGTTTTTSQTVGSIKTQTTPLVTFNLTEIDIPNVKIGDKATITFDAFPNQSFTGKVLSIDSSGLVSSGVTNYPTVIALDTDVPGLYTSMSASANIITHIENNALLVPSGAVQTQNGQSTVRVLNNGKVQSIPVQTGLSSDTQTEITSGLNDGDTVVTGVTSNVPSSVQSSGTSPFSRTFGGGGGGAIFRGGGGGGRGG